VEDKDEDEDCHSDRSRAISSSEPSRTNLKRKLDDIGNDFLESGSPSESGIAEGQTRLTVDK
jgi:hypothetical protein